jgi:hypothetical protein
MLTYADSTGGMLSGRSSIAADRVIVSIKSNKTLLVKRQNLTLVFR